VIADSFSSAPGSLPAASSCQLPAASCQPTFKKLIARQQAPGGIRGPGPPGAQAARWTLTPFQPGTDQESRWVRMPRARPSSAKATIVRIPLPSCPEPRMLRLQHPRRTAAPSSDGSELLRDLGRFAFVPPRRFRTAFPPTTRFKGTESLSGHPASGLDLALHTPDNTGVRGVAGIGSGESTSHGPGSGTTCPLSQGTINTQKAASRPEGREVT